MTYWTDPIATGFFYASVLFALAWVTRAVWRMWWRRDDHRQEQHGANLAAAIADEQRTESRCDHSALDRQVPIVVDPPVARPYIPPAGMVLYRGGAVHPACARGWLRDDVPPCAGCAVWLTDELKASTP